MSHKYISLAHVLFTLRALPITVSGRHTAIRNDNDDHRTSVTYSSYLPKVYSTSTGTLFLPIMPEARPCNIYREQLIRLDYGHALWEPNPVEGFYDRVTIGDVGYLSDGFFHRMFNVTLPCDDPSNQRHGVPPQRYEPLDIGPLPNVRRAILTKGPYLSRTVHSQSNRNDPSAMVSSECVAVRSFLQYMESTDILSVLKVSHISAGDTEPFCVFLMTATARMQSAEGYLRTTSETI